MDQPGDDVFAGATLAVYQNGNIGCSDLGQLGPHRLHRLGVAENDILRGNFAQRLCQRAKLKVAHNPEASGGEYHPRALKVHTEHQTPGQPVTEFQNRSKPILVFSLEISALEQGKVHESNGKSTQLTKRVGKTFHTAEPGFLNCERGTTVESVLSGRRNFNPRRW